MPNHGGLGCPPAPMPNRGGLGCFLFRFSISLSTLAFAQRCKGNPKIKAQRNKRTHKRRWPSYATIRNHRISNNLQHSNYIVYFESPPCTFYDLCRKNTHKYKKCICILFLSPLLQHALCGLLCVAFRHSV